MAFSKATFASALTPKSIIISILYKKQAKQSDFALYPTLANRPTHPAPDLRTVLRCVTKHKGVQGDAVPPPQSSILLAYWKVGICKAHAKPPANMPTSSTPKILP